MKEAPVFQYEKKRGNLENLMLREKDMSDPTCVYYGFW